MVEKQFQTKVFFLQKVAIVSEDLIYVCQLRHMYRLQNISTGKNVSCINV